MPWADQTHNWWQAGVRKRDLQQAGATAGWKVTRGAGLLLCGAALHDSQAHWAEMLMFCQLRCCLTQMVTQLQCRLLHLQVLQHECLLQKVGVLHCCLRR